MFVRIKNAALTATGILFLVGSAIVTDWTQPASSNPTPVVEDQVVASFERELNHEPGPATPARREAIDEDVLYRTINSVHWTVDGNAGKSSDTDVDKRDASSRSDSNIESK